MTTTYWRSAAHDEAMQDEHGFIWEAMLATIDVDLAGRRVLDAGCNRGGFLRLLADRCAIAEGFGYDPAAAAVEDARRLAGDRPLRYEAADTVPAEWHAANAEQLELPPLYEIDRSSPPSSQPASKPPPAASRCASCRPRATATPTAAPCSTGWPTTTTRSSCCASAACRSAEWRGQDSNLRRQCQRVYSASPLTAREPRQGVRV
jgi:hypothetical protein